MVRGEKKKKREKEEVTVTNVFSLSKYEANDAIYTGLGKDFGRGEGNEFGLKHAECGIVL